MATNWTCSAKTFQQDCLREILRLCMQTISWASKFSRLACTLKVNNAIGWQDSFPGLSCAFTYTTQTETLKKGCPTDAISMLCAIHISTLHTHTSINILGGWFLSCVLVCLRVRACARIFMYISTCMCTTGICTYLYDASPQIIM